MYLTNIKSLSEKNEISVCIGKSKLIFNLDKQIGVTNPDELGVFVKDLGDGLKLAIYDGVFKNKQGFYMDVFTDKTYYETALISTGSLLLKNKNLNKEIKFDSSFRSFVLGESATVFCYCEDEFDFDATDLSNYSLFYDIEVQYEHIEEEPLIIDLVNSGFPFKVSCGVLKDKNAHFSIDKRTENKNDFLEINLLNIDEFDNGKMISPRFGIKKIDGEKMSYVTEVEPGKYRLDIKSNMEQVVLEIHSTDFCEQFSGEVK